MKPPTFFLSSTIYDFADLRSAIKFHLESRGCSVLASEFNDFRKPLDRHSYEACLESIEQADYFVLLVGSRVGGWFDADQRISITQREYRTAYELHQAGKLKIIALVRRDIWTFRESQKELEAHLRTLPLESEVATTVRRFPTKFAEDAQFIMDFIEEVARNRDSKAAQRAGDPMPTGNWVHIFSDFRDVAAVLDGSILSGLPANDAAFRRALRREMVEILASCLLKNGDYLAAPRGYVDSFQQMFRLKDEHRLQARIEVPGQAWDRLTGPMINLVGVNLHHPLLTQALAAPTFLRFDTDEGGFRETPVSDALWQLEREIRSASRSIADNTLEAIWRYTPRARGGKERPVIVGMEEIGALVNLAYRWANITDLLSALIDHLDGGSFNAPDLLPFSPVEGFDAALANEKADEADVMRFVRNRSKPA